MTKCIVQARILFLLVLGGFYLQAFSVGIAAEKAAAEKSTVAKAPVAKTGAASKVRRPKPSRTQLLNILLNKKGLRRGDPVFMRIFKREGELELWMRSGKRFTHLKTYAICRSSGHVGPKLRERDYQSPEGFYAVGRAQMKRDSAYHRAFNLGFPNKYDKAWGRTGSLLMVHGACKSVGCYAMTNRGIDEIYKLADAALRAGQKKFWVHSFPFRLTAMNMDKVQKNRWNAYWWNLKEGFDLFEQTLLPPVVTSKGRQYLFARAAEPEIIKRQTPSTGATALLVGKRINTKRRHIRRRKYKASRGKLKVRRRRYKRTKAPTPASTLSGDPLEWLKF